MSVIASKEYTRGGFTKGGVALGAARACDAATVSRMRAASAIAAYELSADGDNEQGRAKCEDHMWLRD